jgi:hypothetical protein
MDYAWVRYDRLPAERAIAQFIMYELLRGGAAPRNDRPSDVPLNGIELLEESFVDPEQRLIAAARFGYFDTVASIIETYKPGSAAMREATRVALAALNNDIALLLLDAGAPVDHGPLHAAARGNSPGLVRDLIARGADPDELIDGETAPESWWARTSVRDFGADGDLVLHELINGGAEVCWLTEHYDELNIFAAGFMRHTATHCW